MIIITTDTKKRYTLTLHVWEDGQWSPDCFGDLEPNFPSDHKCVAGGYEYLATQREVDELIDWWTTEAENANKGIDGDGLSGLTEEEIESGKEYSFNAEEEEDYYAEEEED